jgi:hypothetical protein
MRNVHEWNLSHAQAQQVQVSLAGKAEVVPLRDEPWLMAGLDCAFSEDGKKVFAAAVVLKVPGLWTSSIGGPECHTSYRSNRSDWSHSAEGLAGAGFFA